MENRRLNTSDDIGHVVAHVPSYAISGWFPIGSVQGAVAEQFLVQLDVLVVPVDNDLPEDKLIQVDRTNLKM